MTMRVLWVGAAGPLDWYEHPHGRVYAYAYDDSGVSGRFRRWRERWLRGVAWRASYSAENWI